MLLLRLPAIALFLLLWFAGATSDASIAANGRDDTWRQTSQGWERCEEFLDPPIVYRRPALHPTVVGALELLLTITAMLVFSDDGEPEDGFLRVHDGRGRRNHGR